MAVNTESTTIADLPEATSLTDNDLLVLEAGGTQTKKTMLSRLQGHRPRQPLLSEQRLLKLPLRLL